MLSQKVYLIRIQSLKLDYKTEIPVWNIDLLLCPVCACVCLFVHLRS